MSYDPVVDFRISTTPAAGWRNIVRRIFRDYPGSLAVRLWSGETIFVGSTMPQFTLIFKAPSVFRESLLRRDPLRLAHEYFSGGLEVEGDLYRALDLRNHFTGQAIGLKERLWLFAKLLPLRLAGKGDSANRQRVVRQAWLNTAGGDARRRNELAIAFHYDLPHEFYGAWLDRQMVYSCAYFENPDVSLDDAQIAKLRYICHKLRLKRGDRFLDVGCGWGALAIHAAKHHGVHATGITLSQNQFDWARRRVSQEGLDDRVAIKLLDFREIQGHEKFDKIASVGMFEHVGLKNLPAYFGCIHRLLVPGGLFLNHGITHDEEGWNKSLGTEFINRYVFPDGELDTVSNIQRRMENAQFEIWDVEGLRPHYALTLRKWVSRLEAARDEVLEYVDEATYRVWRLYMAASALHFETGDLGIYQVLASKRGPNLAPLPMTRRDLYR